MIRAFVFAACLATPAAAQDIQTCDTKVELDAVPEPWADNSKTFADGKTRVALIDAIEPAATPHYLAILHLPYDEVGGRRCTMIGFAKNLGYQHLFIRDLVSGYNPALGLTLSIPGRLYDPTTEFSNALILDVVINQATGQVTASHRLGRE